MANTKLFVAFIFLCTAFRYTQAVTHDDEESFNVLLQRIEHLEASDVANKAKIAEMESICKGQQVENKQKISKLEIKIAEMESNFKMKENVIKGLINELKSELASSNGDTDVNHTTDRENATTVGARGPMLALEVAKFQRNKNRKRRSISETEVAFYATHTDHDIHHLGQNQILQFQYVVTNIGSAYNKLTGAFVSPVDGAYIIHATIMGIDAGASHYYQAHFDINGAEYSRFWVTNWDQSSQMLVIRLNAGDMVTVRNDRMDGGFVGQHYSTFSGFLLYQY